MKGPRVLPRDEYSQYWQEADTLIGPQVALVVKSPLANAGDSRDAGWIPGREDSLEEKMATHSSIRRMQTCDFLWKGFWSWLDRCTIIENNLRPV